MRKIPTVFVRDDNDRRFVTREITPGCEWVFEGNGAPTRKYDGTCVQFDGERWWARREVKPGKSAPDNYVAVETDEVTGKTVGWEPVEQSAFARFHAGALTNGPLIEDGDDEWDVGTYELVGTKVNGNPEGTAGHYLFSHADAEHLDAPRDYDGLAKFLADFEGEGIVWHWPQVDGTVRYAKLKKRDFPS